MSFFKVDFKAIFLIVADVVRLRSAVFFLQGLVLKRSYFEKDDLYVRTDFFGYPVWVRKEKRSFVFW